MDKDEIDWEEINWDELYREIEMGHAVDGLDKGEFPNFAEFTVDQWVEWINAFLRLEVFPPDASLSNDDLHLVLINIYRDQESKRQRDKFAEAVAIVFESTPPIVENAEQVYYLAQVISFLRPYQAKRLVRRHLFDGIFRGIEYGNQDLNTMLLVASSKYDVDDDLVDFIYRSAKESKDFRYLLVSLRVLSTRSGKEAFTFLGQLIPYIKSEIEAIQLARQIKGLIVRTGYKDLWHWYNQNASALALNWPEEFHLFEDGLKSCFLPWEIIYPANSDIHATLLSAQLHSKANSFTPDEIIALARLVKSVGEASVSIVLEFIWGRISKRLSRAPWKFYPADLYPGTKNKHLGTIAVGEKRADFSMADEREVRQVLENIKDKFQGIALSQIA